MFLFQEIKTLCTEEENMKTIVFAVIFMMSLFAGSVIAGERIIPDGFGGYDTPAGRIIPDGFGGYSTPAGRIIPDGFGGYDTPEGLITPEENSGLFK